MTDFRDSVAFSILLCLGPILVFLALLWLVWWLLPWKVVVGIPLAIFSVWLIWVGIIVGRENPPTAG
jgi:hypothetical protein